MRKHTGLVVALVMAWLLPARFALAGYDARIWELKEILAKQTLADEPERAVLVRALDVYAGARQRCLDDLQSDVADTNDSHTDEERAWNERLNGCKSDVQRFYDAIKSIQGKRSDGASNFFAVTQDEESKFFTDLGTVGVGAVRDRLVKSRKNIVEMRETLEAKWQRLFGDDTSIHEQEKQVANEIGTIIDQAFDESDRARRTIKEQLVTGAARVAQFVKNYNKPIAVLLSMLNGPDLQSLQEAIAMIVGAQPAIGAYSEIYLKTNAAYIARAATYAALVRSESGGIYVLFGAFRQDTEKFLKENGFDQAKSQYQQGSDAMRRWSSSSATPGQHTDADAFERDVLSKLSEHLSGTERAFNEFVERHKGKFFGPIAPDISEALRETRVWDDWKRMIQDKSLEAKLRQWRGEANTFFTVDLSGLTDVDAQYLRGLVQPRVDELAKSLDEAGHIPEKISHDFDRSDLGKDLK